MEDDRTEERPLLGGHVGIELVDEVLHALRHGGCGSGEQLPECGVLRDVLLEHPVDEQGAPIRRAMEQRSHQRGLGLVVLGERGSQLGERRVQLAVERHAPTQQAGQLAAAAQLNAELVVLREELQPGCMRVHVQSDCKFRASKAAKIGAGSRWPVRNRARLASGAPIDGRSCAILLAGWDVDTIGFPAIAQ